MRICLDFDGVLHDPTNREPGYRMGKPVAGARTAVELLLASGHELVVHSSRVRRVEDGRHVVEWMAYFGFPNEAIHVSLAKPLADVYLDDKAVRFVAWPEAMAELQRIDCSR